MKPTRCALTAEGGIKLKAYVEGEPPMKRQAREPGIYYQKQGRTLAEFADFVAGYFAKPVINATGLDGKYDFNVWFTVDPDNSLFRTSALPSATWVSKWNRTRSRWR